MSELSSIVKGNKMGKLKIWDPFLIIYLLKGNCGGSVGRYFLFFNWELELILFVGEVFLIVKY